MNDPVHTKRGNRWAAAIVTAAVMLAAYVGSYFAFTEKMPLWTHSATRRCSLPWMARLYKPLAAIEEAVTGDDISVH